MLVFIMVFGIIVVTSGDNEANKAVRPRPASAASIPGMLNMLQSEWDALMTYLIKLVKTPQKRVNKRYKQCKNCRQIERSAL